jgi:hypothetical protein
MKRNVGAASVVLALGLTACGGPAASRVAEDPKSPRNLPAGQADTERVAIESPDSRPGEERVRVADLPGNPDGAVGFSFGSEPKEAEVACTRSGHAWKKLDDHTFHCDGLPDGPGMKGTVFVQTCGAEVCLLRVALEPEDAEDPAWLALYDRVLKSLEQQHGEPWQKQHKLPARCQGEALDDCLEKGEAVLDATWHWPGGEKVELRMVPPARARSIAVRLTYSVEQRP